MDKQVDFSIKDTNILKGIAIIMVVIHHLFFTYLPDLYNDIEIYKTATSSYYFWNVFSYFCKIGVTIFLILSGYGLYKTYGNNVIKFYLKRFKKLYYNYWLIWLLFVPIGVFLFHRTFEVVYGTHIVIKFIINLLGLQMFFGFLGYNETWWFITLIVFLYFIFPIVFYVINKKNLDCFAGIILFILSVLPCVITMPYCCYLFVYIFQFYLGGFLAKYDFLKYVKSKINESVAANIILILLIIVLAVIRFISIRNFTAGYPSVVDTILAYLFMQLVFNNISCESKTGNIFAFIGIHSMNIFLFHTFIQYYYPTKKYIYFVKEPILIIIIAFICYIIISLLIERLKKYIKSCIN